ncbi:MAG: hypothetical protein AAF411_08925 [Myxococcota bacterium]
MTHSVELTIYHAPRYHNARDAGGESNVPDLIQLQTRPFSSMDRTTVERLGRRSSS